MVERAAAAAVTLSSLEGLAEWMHSYQLGCIGGKFRPELPAQVERHGVWKIRPNEQKADSITKSRNTLALARGIHVGNTFGRTLALCLRAGIITWTRSEELLVPVVPRDMLVSSRHTPQQLSAISIALRVDSSFWVGFLQSLMCGVESTQNNFGTLEPSVLCNVSAFPLPDSILKLSFTSWLLRMMLPPILCTRTSFHSVRHELGFGALTVFEHLYSLTWCAQRSVAASKDDHETSLLPLFESHVHLMAHSILREILSKVETLSNTVTDSVSEVVGFQLRLRLLGLIFQSVGRVWHIVGRLSSAQKSVSQSSLQNLLKVCKLFDSCCYTVVLFYLGSCSGVHQLFETNAIWGHTSVRSE